MKRKKPEVLTRQEQQRLLAQFNLRYVTPQRNQAMVLLALETGLQLSELLRLRWEEVDFPGHEITVTLPDWQRKLPLPPRSRQALGAWRIRQREEWGSYDLVFSTRTGKAQYGAGVRKMLATYSDKAGIHKRVTTHTLRHTFATQTLEKTGCLREVQRALGHEDISTTQIYQQMVFPRGEETRL